MRALLSRAFLAMLTLVVVGGCPVTDDGGGDPNTTPDPNAGGDGGDGGASSEDVIKEALLRAVYGDGSAGTRSVAADIRLGDKGDVNHQYTDFTVPAGRILTVQSGTVIRCTGTFRNEGTIIVLTGADGGRRSGFSEGTIEGVSQPPEAGISTLPAGAGELGTPVAARVGGGDGGGLSEFEARATLSPGVKAGGGGGAGLDSGGAGGGSLLIVAGGEIVNAGQITANGGAGAAGGGGGGGGVVILASRTKVTHAAGAGLTALGGAGGPSNDESGPGGGGGGGIVHFLAPTVEVVGTIGVAGGPGGAVGAAESVTAAIRSGGGGGGACGGRGGRGGDVSAGDKATPSAAENGSQGFNLQARLDPTALFF